MVPSRLARQLLANAVPVSGRCGAPSQCPTRFFKEEVGKGNVEAIYSHGESHHWPLREAGHLPAGRRKERCAGAGQTDKPSQLGHARAARQNGDVTSRPHCPPSSTPVWKRFLIDHDVEISAQADRRRRQPVVDAAVSGLARRCSSSAFTSGCFGGQRSRAAV